MANIRDAILAAAPFFKGLPYGLPPGPGETDCSLFVETAFAKAGAPFAAGIRTAEQLRQASTPIDWTDVLPGDLLFFEDTYDAGPPSADGHIASHVGISLGAGTKRMWDAHDREADPQNAVGITDISTDYWQDHLFEARRPPQLTAIAPTGVLHGIDVSSNNGAINWPAVAGSGVAYAFIKATGGTWYRNPNFARDWLASKAAGLVRGCYHYAFETSGQSFPGDGPEAEANYFVAEINRAGGLQPGDLLALDIEDGNGLLGDWCLRWLRRVEAATGVKPFVYTGAWFSGPHGFGTWPALASYPLWLAAYQATMPSSPAPWSGPPTIWQNSAIGDVAGIAGDVDTDLFSGTVDDLRKFGKGGVVVPPAPTYVVGEGILAAMAANDDDPASDEQYGPAWSEAMGTSGAIYRWLRATGRVHRYDPAA